MLLRRYKKNSELLLVINVLVQSAKVIVTSINGPKAKTMITLNFVNCLALFLKTKHIDNR